MALLPISTNFLKPTVIEVNDCKKERKIKTSTIL